MPGSNMPLHARVRLGSARALVAIALFCATGGGVLVGVASESAEAKKDSAHIAPTGRGGRSTGDALAEVLAAPASGVPTGRRTSKRGAQLRKAGLGVLGNGKLGARSPASRADKAGRAAGGGARGAVGLDGVLEKVHGTTKVKLPTLGPVGSTPTQPPSSAPPAQSSSATAALSGASSTSAAGRDPRRRSLARTPGAGKGLRPSGGRRAGASAFRSALAGATTLPAASSGTASPRAGGGASGERRAGPDEEASGGLGGTVHRFVEVVPDSVKFALAALCALSVMLAAGYLFSIVRARSLKRQRRELLSEVGLLQAALLPPLPETLGGVRVSVAYRPAEGPGAGGDFYDALPLPGGRSGFILGDVSGHGRTALARTAFLRYTLRAYLEAGLEPRVALQVAGRVIDENLSPEFATVVLAVHDPASGSLTFATAGHPAPIVVGPRPYRPVNVGSSPPIGLGLRTGLRQTTIPLAPGSLACLFTDGLTEARTEGGILGRGRLSDLVAELGRDATAPELLDRVAAEARVLSDDMACCIVAPTSGVTAGGFRTEQLELSRDEVEQDLAVRFLEACGVVRSDIEAAERDARVTARRFGGAVVTVSFGVRQPRVEVVPRNVESIESASRRSVAALTAPSPARDGAQRERASSSIASVTAMGRSSTT